MRKITNLFLALGVIALMGVTTSCEDNTTPGMGPTLSLKQTDSTISTSATVEPSSKMMFYVVAQKGDVNLESFTVINDLGSDLNPFPLEGSTLPDKSAFNQIVTITAPADEGDYNYTFILTDKDGLQDKQMVTIAVASASTPLSDAQTTEWQRVGGADGTGLSSFGLKWTSNTTTSAVITKDGADKFVQLTESDWESITTAEELQTKVDAGTDMDKYTGISVSDASKTYTDVLATKYNNGYFIIKIESSAVSSTASGTTVTISVKYKE